MEVLWIARISVVLRNGIAHHQAQGKHWSKPSSHRTLVTSRRCRHVGILELADGRQRLQRTRFDRSATCAVRGSLAATWLRVLRLRWPYLWFCTLSNPFSNWVTSGVSPDARPSRPMTRQRKLP